MRLAPFLLAALALLPPPVAALEEPGGPPRLGSDNCPPTARLTCLVGGMMFDSGTTVGANNTVTQLVNGCPSLTSVPGPDVAYQLSNELFFSMAVAVTPQAGYDVAVYLLSNTSEACPAGVSNAVHNCVAAVNAGGPGVTETLFPPPNLPIGQYFLFVDSVSASGAASAGTYTIQLLVLCPVELIDYSIE